MEQDAFSEYDCRAYTPRRAGLHPSSPKRSWTTAPVSRRCGSCSEPTAEAHRTMMPPGAGIPSPQAHCTLPERSFSLSASLGRQGQGCSSTSLLLANKEPFPIPPTTFHRILPRRSAPHPCRSQSGLQAALDHHCSASSHCVSECVHTCAPTAHSWI